MTTDNMSGARSIANSVVHSTASSVIQDEEVATSNCSNNSVRTASDRRKVFVDKLYQVSRMHVDEAEAVDPTIRGKALHRFVYEDDTAEPKEQESTLKLQSALQYLQNLAEMTRMGCGARQEQLVDLLEGTTLGQLECDVFQRNVVTVMDRTPLGVAEMGCSGILERSPFVETSVSNFSSEEDDDTYSEGFHDSTFDHETYEDSAFDHETHEDTTASTGYIGGTFEDDTAEDTTFSIRYTGPLQLHQRQPKIMFDDGSAFSSQNSAWL